MDRSPCGSFHSDRVLGLLLLGAVTATPGLLLILVTKEGLCYFRLKVIEVFDISYYTMYSNA